MNLRRGAALVIRSLMRDLRVSDHIVHERGGSGNIVATKLLAELEAPSVGDGTPDAALAIAEHAFKAGWTAKEQDSINMTAGNSVDRAWSDYDPPEDIKALS